MNREIKLYAHCSSPSEFADNCNICGGKIKFLREGSFAKPCSDITQCDCVTIEHANSIEFMGNTMRFGKNIILTSSND